MKNTLLIFGLLIIFQTANCQEVITDFLHKEGDLSSSPSDFVKSEAYQKVTGYRKASLEDSRLLPASKCYSECSRKLKD
ncbi:MAG: hypothetical protein ACI9YE_000681 [Psychroserpens sp.]|jgi:hypothetical protein